MTTISRKKIKKPSVDLILSLIDKPQEYLIFEMGVAYKYHGVPAGIAFSADYPSLGKKMWASIQYDLHQTLCQGKKTKQGLDDFLGGNNARELSVAVLTLFVAQLSVPLSIAIPAAAMVVKLGLNKFCSKKPPKTKISVKELLAQKTKTGRNNGVSP